MTAPTGSSRGPESRTEKIRADASGEAPLSPTRRRTKQGMKALDLSSIGLVFPVAMFLGYWVGGVVGGWIGFQRPGQLIGGFLGIVSGFYNVYKVVLRLNAEAEAQERRAGG